MEKMTIHYTLDAPVLVGHRAVCGVVGSGNLEVIVESCADTVFEVTTSLGDYEHIWRSVIDTFVNQYQPSGLKFTLNDGGATPFTVSLRLRQAFEAFQGDQSNGVHYVEMGARHRIASLLDQNTFEEWLSDRVFYSPHLQALDLPCEVDDGVVIGSGQFDGHRILVAAQQREFMGGAVGEMHGAKLTGLFYQAVNLGVHAVVLLIDSGGVRLQEANAGEIAISEIIRAIFAARQKGILTIGIVCGKNGAFGGMGIVSGCLDAVIVNEIARIGVSGAEVIQTVKGVEAFDSQNHPLVWRVYGGRTRYLQTIATGYVHGDMDSIKASLKQALQQTSLPLLTSAKERYAELKKRFETTQGFHEEGEYLAHVDPKNVASIFNGSTQDFLAAALSLKQDDK